MRPGPGARGRAPGRPVLAHLLLGLPGRPGGPETGEPFPGRTGLRPRHRPGAPARAPSQDLWPELPGRLLSLPAPGRIGPGAGGPVRRRSGPRQVPGARGRAGRGTGRPPAALEPAARHPRAGTASPSPGVTVRPGPGVTVRPGPGVTSRPGPGRGRAQRPAGEPRHSFRPAGGAGSCPGRVPAGGAGGGAGECRPAPRPRHGHPAPLRRRPAPAWSGPRRHPGPPRSRPPCRSRPRRRPRRFPGSLRRPCLARCPRAGGGPGPPASASPSWRRAWPGPRPAPWLPAGAPGAAPGPRTARTTSPGPR